MFIAFVLRALGLNCSSSLFSCRLKKSRTKLREIIGNDLKKIINCISVGASLILPLRVDIVIFTRKRKGKPYCRDYFSR